MDFDKLKAQLLEAEYSDSQFKELRAITEIRLGNFTARAESQRILANADNAYTHAFYAQLRLYLEAHCKISTPPIHVLRRRSPKVYANAVQCALCLHAVAEEWNSTHTMRRPYVTAVYRLYCKLAVVYLRDCKVPVSATTMVQHSDKFVGLVDKAYPGYVEGRIMDVVILGPGKSAEFGEVACPP